MGRQRDRSEFEPQSTRRADLWNPDYHKKSVDRVEKRQRPNERREEQRKWEGVLRRRDDQRDRSKSPDSDEEGEIQDIKPEEPSSSGSSKDTPSDDDPAPEAFIWRRPSASSSSSSSSTQSGNFRSTSACYPEVSAAQFNNTPHARQLIDYMRKTYNRVVVDDMKMLQAGQFIYYLDAYTINPERREDIPNCVKIGGVRVQQKGRFAVVLGKTSGWLQVAPVYTFLGQGLAKARRQEDWDEYVSLQDAGARGIYHPSKHLPVEIHCHQILIGGALTNQSLRRLRELIAFQDAKFV